MPITTSAKKALRQSVRKRVQNLKAKNALKELLKQVKILGAQKNVNEIKTLFPKIQKALDRAAKIGVIKKNTASRKKSRIAKLFAKAG